MEGDAVYFSRRAQEERDAASQAPHATARQIHLEMADRYDELAAAMTANPPPPGPGTIRAA